jgi:pimeloyl-ACP methyl ester carboxylesterase
MTGGRLDLAAILDPNSRRRPPYRRLVREMAALLGPRPASPDPADLPHGVGTPVLVLPAFLTGDGSTRDLRQFLERCGFRPFGWDLGVNWGPTPRLLDGALRRFDALSRTEGPLALIGISLGGLLARNLAYERPNLIRHVITIASPFRLPAATTLGPLVRLCTPAYSPAIQVEWLLSPLPVPSTMIFTRDDGIVAWDRCVADDPHGEAVELSGPHLTLGSDPRARQAIVRRLAP